MNRAAFMLVHLPGFGLRVADVVAFFYCSRTTVVGGRFMGPGSLGGCSTSANGGDELSPTSSRVDRNSLPKKRIQGRQNEQREQGRAYQAPNYHGRERLLNFCAGARRDRHGHGSK